MVQRVQAQIQDFLKQESSGGLVLMAAAVLAMIVNNTALASVYQGFLNLPIVIQVGPLEIAKPLLLWVNDGLMAVFFFLVGLEIKREIVEGELSSFDKAALPIVAAVGGMAVPAGVFALLNMGDPEAIRGWAIPAATDIAFALGILALMGPRVPVALKIFLLAVAIIDDLGAIVIIAAFYTADVSTTSLLVAGIGLAFLIGLNLSGVGRIAPYVIIGIIMWVAVLKSGVHATLAGVLLAFTIPMRTKDEGAHPSPLKHLEHELHLWVAFLVLPIFAFSNAGVSLGELSLSDVVAPLPLGIALGLLIGKQVGIMTLCYLGVRSGLCKLPTGVTWKQIYGVACLCGIGFTMSLFIGTLAFNDPDHLNAVRLGVLMGSIASAIVGFVVLRTQLPAAKPITAEAE
ncbi:MAG: Na+/H+ antiporter NhaA [Kiloniellales bacterium]